MSRTDRRPMPQPGRGLAALLATVPLVLAAFVVGYGVGSGGVDAAVETVPAQGGSPGRTDHRPVVASFTATGFDGPAPAGPSALPVGVTDDLGLAVVHLQFVVDESTVGPDHTAELRMPVLAAPEDEAMTIEVSSVHPVECLCSLTADTAPPYGRVWDTAVVETDTTEVVFDVTGAIDAPGHHGFAVSTPETANSLAFESPRLEGRGPILSTETVIDEPSSEEPPPEGSPSETSDDEPETPATEGPSPADDRPTALVPEAGQAARDLDNCVLGQRLVPTCGALVGVAAGAHTDASKEESFLEFEQDADRTQQIHHVYERADERLFPTPEQIELTEDPERPRTLFVNWKPQTATWAEIAEGDPEVDAYLLDLADHIKENFDKPFFFTVHHEPENDVVQEDGSGMEAADYARMYRYVVSFLREREVDNLVTVMNYMGYLKWVDMPWRDRLYPGDDVVDWIGLSGYGRSPDDGGRSDFAEIVDQTDGGPWPGFYHWVGQAHPDKPMMLAEWGVFHENDHPNHQRDVFEAAAEQFAHYPRLKAIVYFSSPDAEGRNSEITVDPDANRAFRELMASRHFEVAFE